MSNENHSADPSAVNSVADDVPFTVTKTGDVVQLDERRAQREQAKAEPAMPAEVDFEELMAKLVKKALMDQERAKRKKAKGGGGEPPAAADECGTPSMEMRYCAHFEAQWDYKVGGVADKARKIVDRRAYRWIDDDEGAYWHVLGEEQIQHHAMSWIKSRFPGKVKSSNGESCWNAMFDLLSFDDRQTLPRMLDPKVTLMPVRNAYLFIDPDGTIRAKQPNPDFGVTHAVPADIDWSRVDAEGIYTPQEVPEDSAWGSYLRLFMSEPSACRLLQEATGASFLSTNFEKAFFLVGSGSNGKSTYLNILQAFHPAHEAMPLSALEDEKQLSKLAKGTTLMVSSENVKYIGREGEQIFKAVISHDLISARAPYGAPLSFRFKGTVVAAMNEAMQFSDRTRGLVSKLVIIPFMGFKDRNASGAIRDFDQQVLGSPKEMGVVLDWALDGVKRIRQQGDQFSTLSDQALEAAKAIKLESDAVARHLAEVDLRLEPAVGTFKDAIYQDYVQAAIDSNNKPVCAAEFWRGLREYVRTELGGELEEAQPAGGRRDAKRVSRIVNVSIRGIKPVEHRWKNFALPTEGQLAGVDPIF